MRGVLFTRKRVLEVEGPASSFAQVLAEAPTALRTEFRSRWRRRGLGGIIGAIVTMAVGIVVIIVTGLHQFTTFGAAFLAASVWFVWPLVVRKIFGVDQRVFLRASEDLSSWEAFPAARDLAAALAALSDLLPGVKRPPGGAPHVMSARALKQMTDMDVEKRFVRRQILQDQLKDPATLMWALLALAAILGTVVIVLTAPQAVAPPGGTLG